MRKEHDPTLFDHWLNCAIFGSMFVCLVMFCHLVFDMIKQACQ